FSSFCMSVSPICLLTVVLIFSVHSAPANLLLHCFPTRRSSDLSIYRRERALNFSLASVGILAQGRTSVLPVNYRNPKRILHFAYAFSREYFEKHQNREIPLVQPQAGGEEIGRASCRARGEMSGKDERMKTIIRKLRKPN